MDTYMYKLFILLLKIHGTVGSGCLFSSKRNYIFCFIHNEECFSVLKKIKTFTFQKLRPYKGVSFPFQQVFFVRREVRGLTQLISENTSKRNRLTVK